MAKALLGPILSDVLAVSNGRHFILASAFYSGARLDATTISAQSADILVRLDINSIDEWVARSIAPDALLRFWKRHTQTEIHIYCSATAHAKVYVGDRAFLVGSANFTVRGLAGSSSEILWRENDLAARRKVVSALKSYRADMQPLTLPELEDYVGKNLLTVTELQKSVPRSPEDVLPSNLCRPSRVGSYDDFLSWLEAETGAGARVILARARGQGNLSGHIRMNFYGIRQFLLAHPGLSGRLCSTDPSDYKLRGDARIESALNGFVENEAIDEGGLRLDTWRTYLPAASGGKPKSGGGTSGNLNRMLPLMAKYLKHSVR